MYIKLVEKFDSLFGNRKGLVSNIFWSIIGKLFNLFSSVLVGIFIARYLGPEQYGLMNYVVSYVTLFAVVSSFGLDNIEIRELSKRKNNSDIIIGTALKIRLYLSVFTCILISISLFIFSPGWEPSILILVYALSIIFNSFIVFRNYFAALLLNKNVVKTEIFRSFIGSIVKVVLLLLKVNLLWFVLALVLDSILLSSGYFYTFKKYFKNVRLQKNSRRVGKILLKAAFPLLLSGMAIVVYQKIDQIIIMNLIGAESLGYYSIASQFVDFLAFIPIIISQTMTPILVKSQVEDCNFVYENKKQFFLDVTLWLAISMAVALFLFSGIVVKYIYGLQYVSAISALKILSWKIIFISMFISSGQIIIIENIQKFAMLRNIIGCIISISANFILIPIWGINGSALATLFTFLFSGFLSHYFISDYKPFIKCQIRSIVWGWKSLYEFKKSFYE